MADLTIANIDVRYGGVHALDDVSLTVARGRIVGLIGPNGAGKTSLVNTATGFTRPDAGTIALGNQRIQGWPPHRIARAGIARTYQNIRLFGKLDVRTNLAAGAFAHRGLPSEVELRALLERAGIAHVPLGTTAATLPYGDQRRLEIARVLAARPHIALFDEPAAGMNPAETARLVETLRAIAASGIGILLIEHDMSLVRAACDDVVVLDFGRVLARGTPAEIVRDQTVIDAYLGSSS